MFDYYIDFETEEKLARIITFFCRKDDKLFYKIWSKIPGTTMRRLDKAVKNAAASNKAAYERGEEPVDVD